MFRLKFFATYFVWNRNFLISEWFPTIPTGIYLFKVNNCNTITVCEICSNLTIKTSEQRQWHQNDVISSWQWEGTRNEFFVRIVYSGKLQPSQVVYTPRSRRRKIRCPRKIDCVKDIQGVYWAILSQHIVVHWTSG